jgi:hypothetical protein
LNKVFKDHDINSLLLPLVVAWIGGLVSFNLC